MLEPGTIISGKYRLDRVIASGGMGVVFASTHIALGSTVALKLLRRDLADDKKAGARLLGEARTVATLRSEHIAKVIDVGAHDNAPFIVMELLDGRTVYEAVHSEGPLSSERAADLVIQACHALGEAHKHGIVHRDVKPSNLFLARSDDGERLKVIDFGVSKSRPFDDARKADAETATGTLVGSPSFMSPEQIRSARDVDGRSDVWSLGVVLYFMLTGKRPFDADSLLDLMTLIVHEPAPALRAARPDAPPALEAIVQKCLEKDAARRFPTTADLALALAPLASPPMRALAAKVPVGNVTRAGATEPDAPPARARGPELPVAELTAPATVRPGEPAEGVTERVPATPRGLRRGASVLLAIGLALGLVAAVAVVGFPAKSAAPAKRAPPASATPDEVPPAPVGPVASAPDRGTAPAPEAVVAPSVARVVAPPPSPLRARPRPPPAPARPSGAPRPAQVATARPELPNTPD